MGAWRLLTDPTFDPPRPPLRLRLGLQLPKLTGPPITPANLGPPLSRPIVGEGIGFALGREGQAHGKL